MGCNICGGVMVGIRGRRPGDSTRMVCPTCAVERLETIHQMSAPDYGTAYTNTDPRKKLEAIKPRP